MTKELKNIVVIYHGDCLDGFGGAFAAWKKFGESASYLVAENRQSPEWDLVGKEVYIIDFSYPEEILLDIEKKAARLVVLDHHISARDAVESVREHVFDNDHSGAAIAWKYLHQDKPLPKLLAHVEDGDLWKNSLPFCKEIGAFLGTVKFDFDFWEKLAEEFEDEKLFEKYTEKGTVYSEYFDYVCRKIEEWAELVEFEGYKVLAVNSPRLFRSEVGHRLAVKHPPFSIVWYIGNGMHRFSLVGNGSVDVSKIAEHYGGGGHHNIGAFRLPVDSPLPFKFVSGHKK